MRGWKFSESDKYSLHKEHGLNIILDGLLFFCNRKEKKLEYTRDLDFLTVENCEIAWKERMRTLSERWRGPSMYIKYAKSRRLTDVLLRFAGQCQPKSKWSCVVAGIFTSICPCMYTYAFSFIACNLQSLSARATIHTYVIQISVWRHCVCKHF